jgi:hypothetical protein
MCVCVRASFCGWVCSAPVRRGVCDGGAGAGAGARRHGGGAHAAPRRGCGGRWMERRAERGAGCVRNDADVAAAGHGCLWCAAGAEWQCAAVHAARGGAGREARMRGQKRNQRTRKSAALRAQTAAAPSQGGARARRRDVRGVGKFPPGAACAFVTHTRPPLHPQRKTRQRLPRAAPTPCLRARTQREALYRLALATRSISSCAARKERSVSNGRTHKP